MKRKIRTYGGYFEAFMEAFMETLKEKEQEKIQKTPLNEIEKAIKIKEAYYADKQSQNR